MASSSSGFAAVKSLGRRRSSSFGAPMNFSASRQPFSAVAASVGFLSSAKPLRSGSVSSPYHGAAGTAAGVPPFGAIGTGVAPVAPGTPATVLIVILPHIARRGRVQFRIVSLLRSATRIFGESAQVKPAGTIPVTVLLEAHHNLLEAAFFYSFNAAMYFSCS